MQELMEYTLYTYCRSSAAYRVRIALNLKGIKYKSVYVSLVKEGGQEKLPAYQKINPQQMVPSLLAGKEIITQSLAIIEYLDDVHANPPLLPTAVTDRAFVRSLVLMIACDVHPLDNLRVLAYLENNLSIDRSARDQWYCHWIQEGFLALEKRLATYQAKNEIFEFCLGSQVTMVDIFLVPQVYNAIRFNCELDKYPIIKQVFENCMKLAAFQQAAPEQQADFG